jgi:hypothetical protein
MACKILWMLGLVMVGLLAAMTVVQAEEADKAGAAKAFEKGDPDNVDPATIKGDHWLLDITYEPPMPIVVAGADGEKEVYWYVIYTITNNTKADRNFVPSFILFSDTGAVREAGVHPTVFAAIKKLRGGKYPTLENACQMVSIKAPADQPMPNAQIKMGADNARTGVAIFAPLDRNTVKFNIFIQGLSGEYIERPDRPAKIEPGHLAEGDKVTRLYKTLALSYDLPGDKWWLNMDTPVFTGKKWTWR